MLCGKAGKSGCQKRPVHDQPGIALFATVVRVVVNAVGIEGDRGIAKKRGFSKLEGVALVGLAGFQGRVARERAWFAIDDVLQFGDDGRVPLSDFMLQRDQSKPAASSPLLLDVVKDRDLLGGEAGPEGRVKREPSSGPHANWKAQVRNESARPGMAVPSDQGLVHGFPKEGEMRERRQDVTRFDAPGPSERSQQCLGTCWIYRVCDGHGLRH